jgi:hypothetical protein
VLGEISAQVGFGFNNEDPRANGVWVDAVAFDIRLSVALTQADGFKIRLKIPAPLNLDRRTFEGQTIFLGWVVGGRLSYAFDGSLQAPNPLAASLSGFGEVTGYTYWPPPPGQTANILRITLGLRFATSPEIIACITVGIEVCTPKIGQAAAV